MGDAGDIIYLIVENLEWNVTILLLLPSPPPNWSKDQGVIFKEDFNSRPWKIFQKICCPWDKWPTKLWVWGRGQDAFLDICGSFLIVVTTVEVRKRESSQRKKADKEDPYRRWGRQPTGGLHGSQRQDERWVTPPCVAVHSHCCWDICPNKSST